MKVVVISKTEKTAKYITLTVPVYEDDLPEGYHGLKDGVWSVKINIEHGQLVDFKHPQPSVSTCIKAVDRGVYTLISDDGEEIARIDQDYVPNSIIPGEYGDYIEMDIDKDGFILNWKESPTAEDFEEGD